jgi:uncharacterized protein with PIN domain
MNIIDSSVWLEFFADGPQAKLFEDVIEDIHELVVPSIVLFEVSKRLLIQGKLDKLP